MSLILDVENGKPAQYLYFGTKLNPNDLQDVYKRQSLLRSQRLYRSDSCSLDGWDESGDGACDDDGDGLSLIHILF